jgi:hypothetical protein
MELTATQSAKAQLKSDLATVDLNMEVYKLWLSALGALFILVLTGALNYHDVLSRQDGWVRHLLASSIFAIPFALMAVGVAWTVQLTIYEHERKVLDLADAMNDEQFEMLFRRHERAIDSRERWGMFAVLAGGALSFFALIAITVSACATLA